MAWADMDIPEQVSDFVNLSKLEKGSHVYRVLTDPVEGWVYWAEGDGGKRHPVRVRTVPDGDKWRLTTATSDDQIRHFAACVVWDYKYEKIRMLEITQVTVKRALQEIALNPKWGPDMSRYDINIQVDPKASGATRYRPSAEPASDTEIPTEARAQLDQIPRGLDLELVFSDENPLRPPNPQNTGPRQPDPPPAKVTRTPGASADSDDPDDADPVPF